MNNYAVIVAGGSGTRIRSAVPKQFLLLNGIPILMHTITAFYQCEVKPEIIVVLQYDQQSYWRKLCLEHSFAIPHQLVDGGETRFHSVQNALYSINDMPDSLVAVHDAVRPMVSKYIIENSFRQAAIFGNAITAVKSRDSVRLVSADSTVSLKREDVYLVQTPQTFKATQLKNGYLQPFDSKFTDDASVVEQSGVKIHITEGNYQNIKITYAEDVAIAKLILKSL
jgi:2-C-methyl-D-erythritol 4-phosphate cytidylyltransferase